MKQAAQARIERLADAQAHTNLAAALPRAGLPGVYTTLMAAGIVLVLWQGGEKVIAGAWTLGAFVTYLDLFLSFTGRGFRVPQLVDSGSDEHTSELQSIMRITYGVLCLKK